MHITQAPQIKNVLVPESAEEHSLGTTLSSSSGKTRGRGNFKTNHLDETISQIQNMNMTQFLKEVNEERSR